MGLHGLGKQFRTVLFESGRHEKRRVLLIPGKKNGSGSERRADKHTAKHTGKERAEDLIFFYHNA